MTIEDIVTAFVLAEQHSYLLFHIEALNLHGCAFYAGPDRVSTNRSSKFYYRAQNIGIAIDGCEHHGNIVEFCQSEGWARRIKTRDGKPVLNLNKTALATEIVRGEITLWWQL